MYIPDLVNGEKKVIEENGNLYFTIDGFVQKGGLYELDGDYYYAKTDGTLYRNITVCVTWRCYNNLKLGLLYFVKKVDLLSIEIIRSNTSILAYQK